MDFIIVGAGCAGLVMAIQLKRRHPESTFMILERAPSIGGTWYHNTYPGCAVALPCVTYSMSFDPAVSYTQWYPPQSEILQYLHHLVSKYELQKHLLLNTEFVDAEWDDEKKLWAVTHKNTETSKTAVQRSSILISAIGQLVEPSYGGVQSLDLFQGDVLHCNRWNHTVDLSGKNVVVVGNGASATQVIPSIVGQVRSLTQLIRTPQAYAEQTNRTLSRFTRFLFKYVPFYLRIWRYWYFVKLERRFPQFQSTPEGDKLRSQNFRRCEAYTKATAPRKYWELLIPVYEEGCKPIIGDFDYLASLNAANLKLLQDPVVHLEQDGVVMQSGELYKADVIIFGTGYQSKLYHLDITGREGVSLGKKWNGDFKDHYQTTTISGFPNFFLLYGPNSAPPNMSAIYCFENYVDLILELVKPILDGHQDSVEVTAEAEQQFFVDLRQTLKDGVWSLCRQLKDPVHNPFLYPWNNTSMFKKTRVINGKAWIYQ